MKTMKLLAAAPAKRLAVLSFFAFCAAWVVRGQDFYDVNKIQEIRVYFTQPNWNSILVSNAQKATEPYFVCQRVVINGVGFDSVGVKYKGNSTFNATRKKNPWHIELDNVKQQDYQGFKDIKLANVYFDPSFVREALSYNLMQPYTNLPRANFARMYVNDTLIGLYTNTEAITKSFCKKRFPSSDDNVFVKCTPPSLSGAGTGSSLLYLGKDTTLYYKGYEMASAYGWQQLSDLCDTLTNKTAYVEKILDVDHALWMLAFNILFCNFDSYTGGFTQNYYLWRDDNQRFSTIIWDLNMSFGTFNNLGGTGGTPDTNGLARLTPLLHETNANKPLISKLMANPRFKKMYIAHIRTLADELFRSGLYKTLGAAMQAVVDSAVLQDPNKFYTYAQFKTNLNYGVRTGGGGGPGGIAPGIISLMDSRVKYLDTVASMNGVPPVIASVKAGAAVLYDTVWITAAVTGSTSDGVLIGYRNTSSDYFVRINLFDDGLHRDGAAGDGVYGVGLPVISPSIEYYIWAENAVAGVFSPQRAEHEFYTLRSTISSGTVVLNEMMADNKSTAADQDGEYDDWIELHNLTSQAVDLSGWFLSDKPDLRGKWAFPQGTVIPANGYLIVWADENGKQTGLHANFKLSSTGETVILSGRDTLIVDQAAFGQQRTDWSWARKPNGTGNFGIWSPTFNKNNDSAISAVADPEEAAFRLYPNPAAAGFTVESDVAKPQRLVVFNLMGQAVHAQVVSGADYIPTAGWERGMYLVRVGNSIQKLVIQ